MPYDPDEVDAVLTEVADERRRQFEVYGDQSGLTDGPHPLAPSVVLEAIGDRTGRSLAAYSNAGLASVFQGRCDAANAGGWVTFEHILSEEWAEVVGARTDYDRRSELIQLAAVAVQWVAAIDARPVTTGGPPRDTT